MSEHLKRSRVSKALTDTGLARSFDDAEARLDAVRVCIRVGLDQVYTPAGQACTLTAIATAFKCFGRVNVVIEGGDAPLTAPKYLGYSLSGAARRLGATLTHDIPASTTHVVQIGQATQRKGWWVQCWWDRWLAGTRVNEPVALGDSRLPLSGIFAGSLAIRQVFADIRAVSASPPSETTISLWEPWTQAKLSSIGPSKFTTPSSLWLVGLGHLGQALVWNLLFLPYQSAQRLVVLQDDQHIGEENEATSLLVLEDDVGDRKVRVASRWLEASGWETSLIERRHCGDIGITANDPPFLISGLDTLPPRKVLAAVGFDYMIDAGIGRGPSDFEGIQIRVIPKGGSSEALWGSPAPEALVDELLSEPAYQALQDKVGPCGTYPLAAASVAVPFVGAATGALSLSQVIRLGSMRSGAALLQLELGAPAMVIDGGQTKPPKSYLGGEMINLATAYTPG